MVPSDTPLGVADGDNGEGIQKSPPKRVTPSLDRIPDPTLRVQCALLELLGIEDNPTLSSRLFILYGNAMRNTLNTYNNGKELPNVLQLKWCVCRDRDVDLEKLVEEWRSAG